MNLRQMRERIANKTDHDPEETAYRDQVTLLLNEAYEQVWSEAVWPFASKLVYYDLLPDITAERVQGQTVTTYDGQRNVLFSASVDVLEARADHVVGNILNVHGRDYEVLKVVPFTSGGLYAGTVLVLTEPVRHPVSGSPPASPATIAGQTDWRVKFRYYTLPDDCLEILNLGHRDTPIADGGGTLTDGYKVWGVANRPEESIGLREDRTSDYAELYFPIPPRLVPPAEKLTIGWTQEVLLGLSDFAADSYWEFCWCLQSPDGVYGPLSDPAISQVPSQGEGTPEFRATLSFFSFDDQVFAARAPSYTTRGQPEPLEGLNKAIWYNANFDHATGERLGEPKWLRVLTGNYPSLDPGSEVANVKVTAMDTDASVDLRFANGCAPGNPEYVEFDGQHRRIRPYPRVDSWDQQYSAAAQLVDTNWRDRREDFFKRAELRYSLKPRPLRYDTDTPAMPYQFHQMIVDKALWDVFLKSDNTTLATLYQRRYEKQLKKCLSRMNKTDIAWRFGQMPSGSPAQMWSTDYRVTFEG